MKLLVQSAMIFFGTLLMAGLVALGEPGNAGSYAAPDMSAAQVAGRLLERLHEAWPLTALGDALPGRDE